MLSDTFCLEDSPAAWTTLTTASAASVWEAAMTNLRPMRLAAADLEQPLERGWIEGRDEPRQSAPEPGLLDRFADRHFLRDAHQVADDGLVVTDLAAATIDGGREHARMTATRQVGLRADGQCRARQLEPYLDLRRRVLALAFRRRLVG